MMVNHHAHTFQNAIGFVNGISFTSECTDECVNQNAFYFSSGCSTMVTLVHWWSRWTRFFCAIHYPGSCADELWWHETIKSVLTMGFLEVDELYVWLDHLTSILQENCILECVSTCYVSAMFTFHYDREESGLCMECRVHFLAGKYTCLSKVTRGEACLGVDCIDSQLLHWVDRFKSDQNCFWSKIWHHVNLEGHDIISQYYLHSEDFKSDKENNNKNENEDTAVITIIAMRTTLSHHYFHFWMEYIFFNKH